MSPEPTTLATAAAVLHDLGMLLYGGPMVAFTVLVALSTRLPALRPWEIVRAYRAWGAGFGLSMGTWVLGLLTSHYLATGAFRWSTDDPAGRWTLAAHLVFLALWFWNIRVEIWSLEPLRKLDQGRVIADEQAYSAATRRLSLDMGLQSLLVLAYVVLLAVAPG